MRKIHNLYFIPYTLYFAIAFATANAIAEPIREWDWHLPGDVYKELEFTDRAGVDRAVKLFQQAIDAERRGVKVTELVPRYRAAAGEWRKVQVQGESSGEGSEPLLAYAVFMQGYARQQAHDRNEAMKLYNEVLDIYPEQKFISVPARYMLSCVKRELGDVKKADADLEEIVADKGADGHKIYYNVLRSLGSSAWSKFNLADAADCWSKVVFSKGKPDGTLWRNSRDDLITALIVAGTFDELEAAVLAGIDADKRKDRADAVARTVAWMSETDRYWYHAVTQYLDRRYPKEQKASERKAALEKIRRGFAAWTDGEGAVFEGVDDGWRFGVAQFRAHSQIDKPADLVKRAKALEALVKGAKPDAVDGRARTLALDFASLGRKDEARAAAELAKNHLFKLHLQYEVENTLQEWKAAAMYLSEYCETQPPPPPDDLKRAKYDLAWHYRVRLGEHEKAVKIYQDLDDPPKSLWGLSEALRESGKKEQSYKTLVELTSMFPDEAPEAVLRTAQWRERDGEKEKAISLYRRLLSHPKWKQSRASSEAHQALERYGIATGGAMTNEVR